MYDAIAMIYKTTYIIIDISKKSDIVFLYGVNSNSPKIIIVPIAAIYKET